MARRVMTLATRVMEIALVEMAKAKAREKATMANKEKKKYSYDMACEDLARSFLEDDRAQIKEEEFDGLCCDLAQEIQTVIEDFISIERCGNRWKQDQESQVNNPSASTSDIRKDVRTPSDDTNGTVQ